MKTPILLLTGYLGSGKTTLLNRILSNERGIRFAVIVNDIGEVNIDAELIQKGGIVGQDDNADLVALQNGCICCTLQNDLIKQISDLLTAQKFDYIVIEASGVCATLAYLIIRWLTTRRCLRLHLTPIISAPKTLTRFRNGAKIRPTGLRMWWNKHNKVSFVN